MQGFSDIGVDDWLVRQLGALAITNPTQVQALAIPPLVAKIAGEKEDGALASSSSSSLGKATSVPRPNLIGIAETGGGKTAAFALPILQHLARDIYGIFCVVITASRELGYQLADQFVALGTPLGVRVSIVIGGTGHEKQLESIEKARPHIVVATPGRLAMLMRSFPDQVAPAMRNVKYVVLDEADRILEDHMEDDSLACVRFICKSRRSRKSTHPPQLLMFTATASPRLAFPEGAVWEAAGFVKRKKNEDGDCAVFASNKEKKKKDDHVDDNEEVDDDDDEEEEEEEKEEEKGEIDESFNYKQYEPIVVGQSNLLLMAEAAANGDEEALAAASAPKIPSTIHQTVVSVPHVVKLPFLVVALRHQGTNKSIIVFTNSCVRCELVRMTLQLLGFPVCSLNSLLNQKQRLENLALFKTGISKILVATDVAARGLDIPAANLVLHYDFPKLTATYVHRTGRTGRAGAEGESVALCTESEGYFLQRLENKIGSKVHNAGRRTGAGASSRKGTTGSMRNMTVAEHEELLSILDEVSMAKVTGKTHLLDDFGDKISQHKEASGGAEYKEIRSQKIRRDGRGNTTSSGSSHSNNNKASSSSASVSAAVPAPTESNGASAQKRSSSLASSSKQQQQRKIRRERE